jgi:hypothetical protein
MKSLPGTLHLPPDAFPLRQLAGADFQQHELAPRGEFGPQG